MSFKTHIQKYKGYYITGGVCIVVGITIGMVISKARSNPELINSASQKILAFKTGDNTNINEVNYFFEERSTRSNPIRDLNSDRSWPSQNSCARDTGVSAGEISRYLNGWPANIGDLDLERLPVIGRDQKGNYTNATK